MSWLSSVLTAPGTNAANTNRDRQSSVQKAAGNVLPDLEQILQSQFAFAKLLEPLRQQITQMLIEQSTPGGQQRTADRYRTGALSGATDAANYKRRRLSQGGMGIGAQQGADVEAYNNAQRDANNFQAGLSDPNRLTGVLQGISGAMQPPSLDSLGQTANVIYGRPAPQVGASPLASIAGVLGSMAVPGAGAGAGVAVPPGSLNWTKSLGALSF